MKKMKESTKQNEMGKISNLITDMTLKGAPDDEVARADKHSMCVIDAVKHNLDYKRSEKENNIQELKEIYQSNPNKKKAGGASTLISLANSGGVFSKIILMELQIVFNVSLIAS